MNRLGNAISEIYRMDTMAAQEKWVNRIHPFVKLLLTVVYIVVVVSFPKYNLIGLVGMVIYPLAGFILAELSFSECLWRLRIVLPVVCAVGVANLFFDHSMLAVGTFIVHAGVVSMLTLMMKGVLAVFAAYLLIATTSIEKICYALRLVRLPKILVTQILLTYRYITVLLGEANRMTQAYALRAPGQKGIHFKVWGSLAGHLLLRSIDRANDVYESMTLRGYSGDFDYVGENIRFGLSDILYFAIWVGLLLLFRLIPVISVVGTAAGGIL